MKKVYTLLLVVMVSINAAFAGGGCTIDSTNTKFFSPATDSLPCINRTVLYQQVIQMHVADSIDVGPFLNFPPNTIVIKLDSIQLDSIKNFPTGITYNLNPGTGHFGGGDNGCAFLSGTTTDTTGRYALSLYGTVYVSGIPQGFGYPPDTSFTLQSIGNAMFSLALDVINVGDSCHGVPAPPVLACLIDTNNTAFFNPRPDSIPCVERNVPFTQILQIHVPDEFDAGPLANFPPGIIIIKLDSLRIDSISGWPAGLTNSINPADGFFLGGDNGCALVEGTTAADTGRYPLQVYGTVGVSGIPQIPGSPFPPDTVFRIENLPGGGGGVFSLSINVINTGEPCRPAASVGINDFSSDLNSLISVYPNPNNGAFNIRIDAGRRLKGDMVILDVTGRKVFTEAIDAVGVYTNTVNLTQFAKGLYTLQLRTAEGYASKSISVE